MQKVLSVLFLQLFACIYLLAQDTSRSIGYPQYLVSGIYRNEKEFIDNNPFIKASAIVTPKYKTNSKNDTTNITYEAKFFNANFSDSAKQIRNSFGFCDGKNRFIEKDGAYYMIKNFGKYPYFYEDSPFAFTLINGNPFIMVTSILVSTTSNLITPKVLVYFNKKGILRNATEQSIGFLLKQDKDLEKAFYKERPMNNNVFLKYLDKMNQRYYYLPQ